MPHATRGPVGESQQKSKEVVCQVNVAIITSAEAEWEEEVELQARGPGAGYRGENINTYGLEAANKDGIYKEGFDGCLFL